MGALVQHYIKAMEAEGITHEMLRDNLSKEWCLAGNYRKLIIVPVRYSCSYIIGIILSLQVDVYLPCNCSRVTSAGEC